MLLAALVSVAAITATVPAAAAATDCTPADSWPAARADLAAQVVDLVNAHRTELGLAPLATSPTLTAAATWKARHMAAYGYMTHDDPGPPAARTTGDRMAACGYPGAGWGENLAFGYKTAEAVVGAWLASPEHRANIESPDYRATGVGAAGAEAYWSQTFGTVVDAVSSSAPPAPIAAVGAAVSPARRPSSAHRTVRVDCGYRSRRVSCRVRGGQGALVRIAVVRRGATYARTRTRVAAQDTRLRLHALRRLHAGRYALMVRATRPTGVNERHLTFVVR